jgi:hypothetical protein
VRGSHSLRVGEHGNKNTRDMRSFLSSLPQLGENCVRKCRETTRAVRTTWDFATARWLSESGALLAIVPWRVSEWARASESQLANSPLRPLVRHQSRLLYFAYTLYAGARVSTNAYILGLCAFTLPCECAHCRTALWQIKLWNMHAASMRHRMIILLNRCT